MSKKKLKTVKSKESGVLLKMTAQMTTGAKKALLRALGQDGDESKGKDLSSVIQDKTPEVVQEKLDVNKYNRSNRRTQAFVIRNKESDLYMQRTVNLKTKTVHRKDVPLEQATTFKFKFLMRVIDEVPGRNFDYFMVKRKDGKRVII